MSFADKIIQLEDQFVLKEDILTKRRQALYPSEASVKYTNKDGYDICIGKCMRACYYRACGYPETNPGSTGLYQKADVGSWTEKGTHERWKKMNIYAANNVKFFDQKRILSGELDFIFKNPETNGLVGCEQKSYYGMMAEKEVCGHSAPTKNIFIPGRPKEQQFLQASLYNYFYMDTLEEYIMYYLERGNGRRVAFEIGCDKEEDGTHRPWWRQAEGKYWSYYEPNRVYRPYLIEDILARYEETLDRIRRKDLPPKDYYKVYPEDRVEYLWSINEIAKTKYEAWKRNKNKNPIGDFWCNGYCSYITQCENDSK